jgi:hypothetical protein
MGAVFFYKGIAADCHSSVQKHHGCMHRRHIEHAEQFLLDMRIDKIIVKDAVVVDASIF